MCRCDTCGVKTYDGADLVEVRGAEVLNVCAKCACAIAEPCWRCGVLLVAHDAPYDDVMHSVICDWCWRIVQLNREKGSDEYEYL